MGVSMCLCDVCVCVLSCYDHLLSRVFVLNSITAFIFFLSRLLIVGIVGGYDTFQWML